MLNNTQIKSYSNNKKNMKIIIISGPSGSGKTTLSKKLSSNLENSFVISTDDYYKTGLKSKILSFIVDSYFDRVISLNTTLLNQDISMIIKENRSYHTYKYNFKNKTITKIKKNLINIKYLIIEGIFSNEFLSYLFENNHLYVNLEIKKSECLERILKRDPQERGKSRLKIIKSFHKSWLIYYKREHRNFINKKLNKLTLKKDPQVHYIIKNLSKLS